MLKGFLVQSIAEMINANEPSERAVASTLLLQNLELTIDSAILEHEGHIRDLRDMRQHLADLVAN